MYMVQRCQPLDTKNQTEYPKKSDFREKNQNFTKTQRLSHLLQGRIVALLPILQNSRFCRYCGVYIYMVLCHFTAAIEFGTVFVLFCVFICRFLMKSRIFERQYRIIVFPSFYHTKYDKIVLVGISEGICLHPFSVIAKADK